MENSANVHHSFYFVEFIMHVIIWNIYITGVKHLAGYATEYKQTILRIYKEMEGQAPFGQTV